MAQRTDYWREFWLCTICGATNTRDDTVGLDHYEPGQYEREARSHVNPVVRRGDRGQSLLLCFTGSPRYPVPCVHESMITPFAVLAFRTMCELQQLSHTPSAM
jgi:hypothetical protein